MMTDEIEVLDVVTRTTDLLYKVLSECKAFFSGEKLQEEQ